MEIKTEKRNDILKRQELILEVENEINPTFEDIKKQIAEKFSKPEENINVSTIKGGFGKNKFLIETDIYDSKEDLEIMKNLEMSKKQRKEVNEAAKQAKEEAEKAPEASSEEIIDDAGQNSKANEKAPVTEEKPVEEKQDTAPVEEKEPEEIVEEKPVEAPIEDKPEEVSKAVKEEGQKEEESKE